MEGVASELGIKFGTVESIPHYANDEQLWVGAFSEVNGQKLVSNFSNKSQNQCTSIGFLFSQFFLTHFFFDTFFFTQKKKKKERVLMNYFLLFLMECWCFLRPTHKWRNTSTNGNKKRFGKK